MPRDGASTAAEMAGALRAAIASGEYAPGDRLPGENALMATHGVARMTARTALATLAHEGLTIARRGAGVFVRERPILHRQGTERYARSRWRSAVLGGEAAPQGLTARRTVRRLATVEAPSEVSARLSLPDGAEVWTRQRLVYLDDRPVQTADSYYPLGVVDGTKLRETDIGTSDFAQLDEAGHSPTRIREEWSARMPSPDEADALAMLPGTPVLDFIRTIYDQDDRPVEVMLSLIAADSARMVYDFPVPD
jgi:GntR family transcriptional regulator